MQQIMLFFKNFYFYQNYNTCINTIYSLSFVIFIIYFAIIRGRIKLYKLSFLYNFIKYTFNFK